jgi:beta-mannanase
MRKWSRALLAVVAVTAGLIVPTGVGVAPAAATSTDGALIGVWPHQNISTLDTATAGGAAAFEPGQYLQPSELSYIPQMNGWQGKDSSIIQFYDAVDENAFSSWAPIIWDNYHAIPMMSMNTGDTPLADIAAGSNDGQLHGYAVALKKWITETDVLGQPAPAGGRRFFIRLNWEANASWYSWSPMNKATDCESMLRLEQDYANAWRRVHDVVMDPEVGLTSDQVSWIFSVNSADVVLPSVEGCANGASAITERIFPGDDYVDWVGIDAYSYCSVQTPAQIMDAMVTRLRSISDRPLSTNEVGTTTTQLIGSCATIDDKARWITSYLNYMQAQDMKMSVWFNTNSYLNGNPQDWAVFSQQGPQDIAGRGDCTYTGSTGIVYDTYCEFADGLASPFFQGGEPDNDRIVSDAEFAGTWVTAGGTAPAAPVITAHAGPNEVALRWTAPANGGRGISGYEVLRGTAPGTETLYATLDSASTSFTDTSVTPGATYVYRVRAVNSRGAGPLSNEVSAVPQQAGALVGVWADQPIVGTGGQGLNQGYQPSSLSYVPGMNAWQGKANSVMGFASTLDPQVFNNRAALIWNQYHAIPMMSMDINNVPNDQVAAGAQDNNLFMFGQALQKWLNGTDVYGEAAPPGGRRLYINLLWEGNGTKSSWAPLSSATDCAGLLKAEQDYVAAYRRAVYVISLVGLKPGQVGWMFSVSGADAVPPALQGCANGASDVTRNIFPGDAYVDWTGVTGFTPCSSVDPGTLFDPMVSELRSLSARPVSISDVGASTAQPVGSCTTTTPADKGAWLSDYLGYVEAADVKMSVWRNLDMWDTADPAGITDWAVYSQPVTDPASKGDCTSSPDGVTTWNVYCEYADGLASAHFTGADPANPRIVADAEFLGTWTSAARADGPTADVPETPSPALAVLALLLAGLATVAIRRRGRTR